MVELLFWIWFFLLVLEFKIVKGMYLMADWIVLVVQFRVVSCLMFSWVANYTSEIFFRFFLDHKLFMSIWKNISPPNLRS